MKRVLQLSVVLSMLILVSSCATVLRKEKTQTIKFDPEQKNTMVFVNDEFIGESPIELKVDPAKEYKVLYVKSSYISQEFKLRNGILTKWVIADLACLPVTGFVPLVVDASTGAWRGVALDDVPLSLKHWSDVEDPHDLIGVTFQIQHLYFDINEAVIPEVSKDELDELVSVLNQYPDMKLDIHGHTDVTGDRELNIALSKSRAESVKAYLVEKGIDPGRITTIGHGPDEPLLEGDFEEAYQYNRRVEFEYKL